MLQRTATSAGDLTERVIGHLYRTLPAGHGDDLDARRVQASIGALLEPGREDLSVLPIEDGRGLASVVLIKERRSVLTHDREGFLYCLVPCRSDPPIAASTLESIDRLMRQRGWAALRVSLFSADLPALTPLVDATSLSLGWIVTRKKLGVPDDAEPALPGAVRPAQHGDLGFIRSAWRDAYLAGLLEETTWQSAQAAARAADAELAGLLGSKHCVLLVIEADQEVIGFAAAEVGKPDALTGRRECHLYDCYVAPEYRGRGYSQRGIRRVENLAREHGCQYMTGTVAGASASRIDAILGQIAPFGWTPYQAIYRCRAPLLDS